MTTRELHDLFRPVLPHVGTDKETPELAVVRLEFGDNAVYAAATDRYTLAAERWPLPPADRGRLGGLVVHLNAADAKAALALFTYSKESDPPLRITVDTAPVHISVAGQPGVVTRLAVTVQHADDGTRLVLHDERNPAKDPLAAWRRKIHAAMTRPRASTIEAADLFPGTLGRWAAAARKGERFSVYPAPDQADPILVVVEEHFAGLWSVPGYLGEPREVLDALPWRWELDPLDADVAAGLVDVQTGERAV